MYSPYPLFYTAGKTGLGHGTTDWSKEKYEAQLYDGYETALEVIKTFEAGGKDDWYQIEKVFIVAYVPLKQAA